MPPGRGEGPVAPAQGQGAQRGAGGAAQAVQGGGDLHRRSDAESGNYEMGMDYQQARLGKYNRTSTLSMMKLTWRNWSL